MDGLKRGRIGWNICLNKSASAASPSVWMLTQKLNDTMKRHWTINGRFLTQPVSGVQRYAHCIVSAMDELLQENHALGHNLAIELVAPPGTSAPPYLSAIPMRLAGSGSGHRWEQFNLPRQISGGLISLGNTGPLACRKQVVCIHDLNTRLFPSSYSLPFRTLYRTLIPALGRMSTRVATVSHFSAGELVRHGIAVPAKIRVVPNGHEHALHWQAEHSAVTRRAAGRDTILVIGSAAPHKNVGLLLRMADKLAEYGFRLAIAGMSDAKVFAGTDPMPDAPNIHWLGRVSDNELAALYQDCLCLAFPSLVEGFGLPAVEAMAWDCPVIASDRTSLPEICADAALYANADDPQSWLEQFIKVSQDDNLRNIIIEKGRQRLTVYSWRRSAELYLELIAEIDEGERRNAA